MGYPQQNMGDPQQGYYPPMQPQEEPRRRGPRLGGVIFYTIYFLFIFVFFVGVYNGLSWFQGWLVDYEAAQPTTKCEEIFDQLFADPDWGALYDAAGIEDTIYEGKDVFVAYMEEKVGDRELTYMQTSAVFPATRSISSSWTMKRSPPSFWRVKKRKPLPKFPTGSWATLSCSMSATKVSGSRRWKPTPPISTVSR